MQNVLQFLSVIVSLSFFHPLMAQSPSSFDIIGGADYVYRHWSEESVATVNETPGWGWRVGVNFNYDYDEKWTFKTGLRLASVGYEGAVTEELHWGSEHNGQGGHTNEPDLPDYLQVSHDLWLLELPLVMRRTWTESRWQPYVEAGVAPNILLGVRTTTILDTEGHRTEWASPNESRRRLLHLVGRIGFGIQYQGGDSWQWFAQPTFRYHLFSVASGPIKERPYSGGLETGVRCSFGK